MLKLTDELWLGDSADEIGADLETLGISAILNAAVDLPCTRNLGEQQVIYAHCGLVDGPGNNMAAYYAATFMLTSLIMDKHKVLVCCHEGGRALAVCIMHLHLLNGRGWDWWIALLSERTTKDLPEPHPAHRTAFDNINWRTLRLPIGG